MATKTKTTYQCPECGMAKTDWPGSGYSKNGTLYCCAGCANGTGCTCESIE